MKEPEITQDALTEREQQLLALFRAYSDEEQQALIDGLRQHGTKLLQKGRRGYYAGSSRGG